MHVGLNRRALCAPYQIMGAVAPRHKILITSGSKKGTQIYYFFSLKSPRKWTNRGCIHTSCSLWRVQQMNWNAGHSHHHHSAATWPSAGSEALAQGSPVWSVLIHAAAELSSFLTHCTAATLPSGTLTFAACTCDINAAWLFCVNCWFFSPWYTQKHVRDNWTCMKI